MLDEPLRLWNAAEAEAGVPPEHRSFLRDGRRDPVLLLHGGGGSPLDLVALADDLSLHGHFVLVPLLPAHGLGDVALGALDFEAMANRAIEAFDVLTGARGPAAVVGLSLGAVISVRLAVRRDVVALVALAPALQPFVGRRVLGVMIEAILRPRLARINLRWQQAARRGIRATIPEIPRITAPLLVLHSHDDPSVSSRGARMLYERASSKEKQIVLLDDQGHVLTRAPDLESVFGPVRRFLAGAFARQASGISKTNEGS